MSKTVFEVSGIDCDGCEYAYAIETDGSEEQNAEAWKSIEANAEGPTTVNVVEE